MALDTTLEERPAQAPRPTPPEPNQRKDQPGQSPPQPGRGPQEDPFGRQPPDDGQDLPTHSKLYIPSYDDDIGERSGTWPAGWLSWKSPGIRIERPDGSPYGGGKIDRSGPSLIQVMVANAGTEAARAQVTLYWTDPSAGFGPPHLRRKPVLGASPPPVNVAPGATEITEPVALTPQADTPDHICLIAVVGAFGDDASGTWDVLKDRHYAQHNIDIVQVQAGAIGTFHFNVINPYRVDAEVTVQLRAASAQELRLLSRMYAADAREIGQEQLRLVANADDTGGRPERMLRLRLRPGERRLCQGLLSARGLAPGQITSAEVQTSVRPVQGGCESERHGSYGAVFFIEE